MLLDLSDQMGTFVCVCPTWQDAVIIHKFDAFPFVDIIGFLTLGVSHSRAESK
jgi:hypothetical protein